MLMCVCFGLMMLSKDICNKFQHSRKTEIQISPNSAKYSIHTSS